MEIKYSKLQDLFNCFIFIKIVFRIFFYIVLIIITISQQIKKINVIK